MKTDCLAFNYNKATQQCDFINTLGATETLNPIYMTGPQMCGVMTGSIFPHFFANLKNSNIIEKKQNLAWYCHAILYLYYLSKMLLFFFSSRVDTDLCTPHDNAKD